MKNNKVGIIGWGRFGQVLSQLLSDDFALYVYDEYLSLETIPQSLPLPELMATVDSVFLAVPIRQLPDLMQQIAPWVTVDQTIIDVSSVKEKPVEWLQTYFPDHVNLLATHPMFGPDSFQLAQALKWMVYPVQTVSPALQAWLDYFVQRQWELLLMTPEEHDQAVARSQTLTHLLGRSLKQFGAEPNPVATEGYSRLLDLMQQTCFDSWELFEDMFTYNAYVRPMVSRFQQSLAEVLTHCQTAEIEEREDAQ